MRSRPTTDAVKQHFRATCAYSLRLSTVESNVSWCSDKDTFHPKQGNSTMAALKEFKRAARQANVVSGTHHPKR